MTIRDVALRANAEALRLCEILLPDGKRVGNQWVIGDAYGAPGDSMTVELEGDRRGMWFDHGGSGSGDMLKLIEVNRGLSGPVPAADHARKLLSIEPWRPGENGAVPKEYDPLSKAWLVKATNQWVKPTRAWVYRNAMGKILAYVCRIEWVEGGKQKKDVIPQRLGEDGKWYWKGYKGDEKRPLYGLEFILKQNDGRPLLIVEGEKTADAARKLFPDVLVITWMGGCKAVRKANWKPVMTWKGPIVIWPDNDDAGQTAAIYLNSLFQKARRVRLPNGLPEGWDIADECPANLSLRGMLDGALTGDEPTNPPDLTHAPEHGPGPLPENQVRNQLLIGEYGPALSLSGTGRPNGLNERFFAGLVARENEVLYEPSEGCFFLYEKGNGLWIRRTPDAVRNLIAKRILKYLRKNDEEGLCRTIKNATSNAILAELRGIVERDQAFRSSQPRIHVANGVLELTHTGERRLLPFSPVFMSRHQSPIHYDPSAKCPRFESELLQRVLSPDDALLLQKFCGLALLGRNLPQRILVLHGEGGTSKGTIVRMLGRVVGLDSQRELRTEHLAERFEINRLAGGSLLVGQDVAANFLERPGASMLKKLVGGDYLDGEPKGLNTVVRIQGCFNVIITCNSRLRVRLEGDVSAWRRRLVIIEFLNNPPPKKIPDFEEILLREEGSGILNWAIKGLELILAELKEHGDFQLTIEQQARVDRLLRESDSLRLFVAERIHAREGGTLTTNEVAAEYLKYCRVHDFVPLSARLIENSLPSLLGERFGVTRSNDLSRFGKDQRGWRGVAIEALDDRPDDIR